MIECGDQEREVIEGTVKGPISYIDGQNRYLQYINAAEILKTIWSTLLVVRPDDPVEFSLELLEEMRTVDVDNIRWQDFTRKYHRSNSPAKQALYKECPLLKGKDITPESSQVFDERLGMLTRPIQLPNLANFEGHPEVPYFDLDKSTTVKSASTNSAPNEGDVAYFEATLLYEDLDGKVKVETDSTASHARSNLSTIFTKF